MIRPGPEGSFIDVQGASGPVKLTSMPPHCRARHRRAPRLRSRFGITVLEMLMAFTILVLTLLPLIELMTTTTKGTQLTRDYLVAYNLASMIFEQVVNHSSLDNAGSFDAVAARFNPSATGTAPNGCPGAALSTLSATPDDQLLPDDGDPTLNLETGHPSFVNLYKRYSYSVTIQPATGADTVVTPEAKAALARVDVKVHWKGFQGQNQTVRYSDFIARRKF